MGMYTGLRFKGYIKEEYREMFEPYALGKKEWEEMTEVDISEFSKLERSCMIPRGALCYMPDSWEEELRVDKDTTVEGVYSDNDGFERQYNKETGYWAFQCSLKNYGDEIETFMKIIVPIFVEKIDHLEELYEEWEKSTLYNFVDGKLEQVGEINYYGEEDDDICQYILNYLK